MAAKGARNGGGLANRVVGLALNSEFEFTKK